MEVKLCDSTQGCSIMVIVTAIGTITVTPTPTPTLTLLTYINIQTFIFYNKDNIITTHYYKQKPIKTLISLNPPHLSFTNHNLIFLFHFTKSSCNFLLREYFFLR